MTGEQLRRRLHGFAFVDEFGPLYALYAVWWAAHDVSAGQIGWLFAFWALFAMVAEVPSGALADRVDRRRLIAVALLLRAAGITIWLLWPTLAGITVGVALWAAHTAMASGTWEALVYDALADRKEAHLYGTVMARVGQASHLGTAAGILLAALLLALGADIPLLGWVTVGAHALSIATVLGLPAPGTPRVEEGEHAVEHDQADPMSGLAGWWATLQAGVRAALDGRERGRLLAIGMVLEGLFILDEYQPLLADARGAPAAVVPVLVFAVWFGLLLGGELAARHPRLSMRGTGLLLAAGATLTIAGIASGAVWGLALLGLGYAAQNVAWIITDARFQATVPDEVRATTTSVRALAGAMVNVTAFVFVATLSAGEDPGRGVMALAGVLVLLGLVMGRAGSTDEP